LKLEVLLVDVQVEHLEEIEDQEDNAKRDLLLLKAINARYLPAFANEENVILNDSVLEAEIALRKAEVLNSILGVSLFQ
jgi:hypothetical protein